MKIPPPSPSIDETIPVPNPEKNAIHDFFLVNAQGQKIRFCPRTDGKYLEHGIVVCEVGKSLRHRSIARNHHSQSTWESKLQPHNLQWEWLEPTFGLIETPQTL